MAVSPQARLEARLVCGPVVRCQIRVIEQRGRHGWRFPAAEFVIDGRDLRHTEQPRSQ
jgi:hypothetical protein